MDHNPVQFIAYVSLLIQGVPRVIVDLVGLCVCVCVCDLRPTTITRTRGTPWISNDTQTIREL